MYELGTQILDAYLWCQVLIVQIGDTHIKDMQKNYVIEIIYMHSISSFKLYFCGYFIASIM
jgi:hypothetical protein